MKDGMPTKKEPNFCGYHIRKWYVQIEEALVGDSGKLEEREPLRKIMLAAAIANPYAGAAFSQDLGLIVDRSAQLGEEFGRRIRALVGDEPVASYGKACVVGVLGEYEHGNAFLTSTFADPVRHAVGGGKSWIPSTGKRGGPGSSIDIPLAHKDELYVRSHYDTMTVSFNDGPNPDEVVIAMVVANRGRLHARLGGPAAPGESR
jgi:hypothetical protein